MRRSRTARADRPTDCPNSCSRFITTSRETHMSETKRIATDQLTRYFDAFSKRFLMGDAQESADVEILGDVGDQPVASGVRLLGVDYDPHTNALELELES